MSKIALITGSSRGIGLEIARRLALDGFSIVLNTVENDPELEAAEKEIEGLGAKVFGVRADVSEEKDVQSLFTHVAERFGGIDVVVQNAGVMYPAPIAASSIDSFDRTIRVNLRGTFLVLHSPPRRSGTEAASSRCRAASSRNPALAMGRILRRRRA